MLSRATPSSSLWSVPAQVKGLAKSNDAHQTSDRGSHRLSRSPLSQGQNDCLDGVWGSGGGEGCSSPSCEVTEWESLVWAPRRRANANGPAPSASPIRGVIAQVWSRHQGSPNATGRLDSRRPASAKSAGPARSRPTPPSCRKLESPSRKLQSSHRGGHSRALPLALRPACRGAQGSPYEVRSGRCAPRGPSVPCPSLRLTPTS